MSDVQVSPKLPLSEYLENNRHSLTERDWVWVINQVRGLEHGIEHYQGGEERRVKASLIAKYENALSMIRNRAKPPLRAERAQEIAREALRFSCR